MYCRLNYFVATMLLVSLLASLVFITSVMAQGNALSVPVLKIEAFSPFDGFGFIHVSEQPNEVFDIIEDSPADLAGMQVGDRILMVNGTAVDGLSVLELTALVFDAGPEVLFTVQRVGVQDQFTISLTRARIVPNAFTLNWEAITDAVRYEAWQWENVGGWQRIDDGNLTDSGIWVRDLDRGVAYYFTVRAVNSKGQVSEWAEYVSATIADQPQPLPSPTPQSGSTPHPTLTATPTSTAATTPTPTATATPTPSGTESEYCVLVGYSADDLPSPIINASLIQNDTLLAYRDTFNESLDTLKIVGVIYYSDGTVGIGYLDDQNDRLVHEWFKGCDFTGHSGWRQVE